MDPVRLTDEQAAKLAQQKDAVPLHGPDGKEVGYFLSRKEYYDYVLTHLCEEPSKEKLDAASREVGGRPLAEIIETRLGGA